MSLYEVSECGEPEFPGALIPVAYHATMLGDEIRMAAFAAAISAVVEPGDRVVDLGGGTGVLSYFAARAGAAQVWCVERLGSLAATAAAAMTVNEHGGRVTVVVADAHWFLPPEPVDVVLCEMLHVGLLREHQIAVIDSFKRRYLERFGGPLPRFVPEATMQAVQLVSHDFSYHGYDVKTPVFEAPQQAHPRTVELSAPLLFQAVFYDESLPARCQLDGCIDSTAAGRVNAVRMITKSVLVADVIKNTAIEWFMNYLIMPLAADLEVTACQPVPVRFDYAPGDELTALAASLRVGS